MKMITRSLRSMEGSQLCSVNIYAFVAKSLNNFNMTKNTVLCTKRDQQTNFIVEDHVKTFFKYLQSKNIVCVEILYNFPFSEIRQLDYFRFEASFNIAAMKVLV